MAAVLLDTPAWGLYLYFVLGQPMGWAILIAGAVAGAVGSRYPYRLPMLTGVLLGVLSGFAVPAVGWPWLRELYRAGFEWALPAVSAILALVVCLLWPWVRRTAVRVLRLSPP